MNSYLKDPPPLTSEKDDDGNEIRTFGTNGSGNQKDGEVDTPSPTHNGEHNNGNNGTDKNKPSRYMAFLKKISN